MTEMMKNQPSQWWWLENHGNTRRSPWLQSTLTELNEKTKAMLKLIEEDADSFAQRAEMYYKKRPQLVSMVEDFYRTHRSLAERYDQVTGIRQQKTGGSSFSLLKQQQPEKLMNFADETYDSYSESCDVEESGESEIDDPEQEEEEGTRFDNCTELEKVQFVAANDVIELRKEIEILFEENKDQNKQKYNIYEVVMLREEIEQLRKENRAQEDELNRKSIICGEVIMLREEMGRLRKENRAQKDELNKKDIICGEATMMREEIEQLSKENRVLKDELNQKSIICGEVMMLREEIGRLRKDELGQKDIIYGEAMMFREEIEQLSKENRVLKDQLNQKSIIFSEVMMLWEELEQLGKENGVLKDELNQKYICGEVMISTEEIEQLRKENRAQKDELDQKSINCEVMMSREEIELKEDRVKNELNRRGNMCGEVMMLREEIERLRKDERAQKGTICGEVMMLRQENSALKDHLKQKDQEKIEVIRHLTLAIDMLKQENVKMRSFIAKESANKLKNPFGFKNFVGSLSGNWLNGLTMNQPSLVAL